MGILSSSYTVGVPQADGRVYVRETHVDQDGVPIDVEYLADPDANFQSIMDARAANMSAEIDAKLAVEAEARNFKLPLTRLEFLRRFTVQERVAARQLAASDPVVYDFLDLLGAALNVVPTDPDVQMGLGYLVSVGVLTADRAREIGAA